MSFPFATAEALRHPPRTRSLLGWLAALAWLATGATAWAHDPGLSTAEARWKGDQLELVVSIASTDARQLLGSNSHLPPAIPLAADRHWPAIAPTWCDVLADGVRLAPTTVHVNEARDNGVSFRLVYRCPPRTEISVRLTRLGQLPRGHREFMVVTDDQDHSLAEKFLTTDDPTLKLAGPAGNGTASTTAQATAAPTFFSFVRLGVEHIWTGYDHLLFLFGLLVVCRSFRSITLIISCFTVAHSLTLAVATLNLVNLSGRYVEPAIAASIIFVGVENLIRGGAEPRGRFVLTFAFGLIHGFGFATALRDLGVGSGTGSVVLPLFAFNFGVELGQIAVAAAALPIVWQLRKGARFVQFGVPALSSLVAAAGLYWFLERTVLA